MYLATISSAGVLSFGDTSTKGSDFTTEVSPHPQHVTSDRILPPNVRNTMLRSPALEHDHGDLGTGVVCPANPPALGLVVADVMTLLW